MFMECRCSPYLQFVSLPDAPDDDTALMMRKMMELTTQTQQALDEISNIAKLNHKLLQDAQHQLDNGIYE